MNDRWASTAFLMILVLGFVSALEEFDLGAGLMILAMLVAPFSILIIFATRGGLRTTRGWDRDDGPNRIPPAERRDWGTRGR